MKLDALTVFEKKLVVRQQSELAQIPHLRREIPVNGYRIAAHDEVMIQLRDIQRRALAGHDGVAVVLVYLDCFYATFLALGKQNNFIA